MTVLASIWTRPSSRVTDLPGSSIGFSPTGDNSISVPPRAPASCSAPFCQPETRQSARPRKKSAHGFFVRRVDHVIDQLVDVQGFIKESIHPKAFATLPHTGIRVVGQY